MKTPNFRLTRQDFLRILALGGGAAALAACSPEAATSTPATAGATTIPGVEPLPFVDVTLKTSGWPIDMPVEGAPAGSYQEGYAKAFQKWLALNPGVKVEQIEFNPWAADGLRTAIAGGTAPFCYPIGVLGGWNVPGIQASYAEGMFADITAAFNQHQVLDLLDPTVANLPSRWKAGAEVFGIPYEITSSQGFFYNRQHLAEIGMDKLPLTWSWQDMREISLKLTTAGRQGLAMAAYALNWILPSYGIGFDGLISRYPVPGRSFNWRWDFTTFGDDMVDGVNLWRGMFFEDKSVFSDPNYWDFSQNGTLATAFYEQKASMTPGIHLFFSDMAQKMNLTIQELDAMVNFQRAPLGPLGFTPELPMAVSAWAFNPDLSTDEMDKAVSLFSYLLLGEGFVDIMKNIFDVTGDASQIIRAVRWPYANKYSDAIPGVDASLPEATGSSFSSALAEIFAQPKLPEVGEYTPAEVNRGPGDTPWYDKITRWAFTQDAFDVKSEAVEMEGILNQQAKSFPSGVDETAFAEGVRRYYADWSALLQVTAPQFYEQRFKPFYDLRVKPEFG